MVKTYIVHNKQTSRVMLNLDEHNGVGSDIFYCFTSNYKLTVTGYSL